MHPASCKRERNARRLLAAEIDSAKKHHACAPSPERDRSVATGRLCLEHIARNLRIDSRHPCPSKSAAMKFDVLFASNGYTSSIVVPTKCFSIQSAVSGAYDSLYSSAYTGEYPATLPFHFCHRRAKTSSRPRKSDLKRSTRSCFESIVTACDTESSYPGQRAQPF